MNWVKENIEQTVLLLLLAVLSVVATMTALNTSVEIPEMGAATGGKKAKLEADLESIAKLTEKLDAANPWVLDATNQHRLFISRKIEWLPKDKVLKVYDVTRGDDFGITREWKSEYGLSQADPLVGLQDPDSDGFASLYEFRAEPKTDPTKAESHPPRISLLRLSQFQPKTFRILFSGYEVIQGIDVFQLRFKDAVDKRKRTNLLKAGEEAEDWVVGEFRKKTGKRFNPSIAAEQDFDESELDVANKVTGVKATLLYKSEQDCPDPQGTLIYIGDKKEIPVAQGRNFEFFGGQYKLERIDAIQADVVDVATGSRFVLSLPDEVDNRVLNGQ